MEPKVSVIVPVYNGEKYVENCCRQLSGQTLKDMEFILVNDGSTDRTSEICDEMAARYGSCRVVHQKNQGVSAARNHGIEAASGEYLGFVDVDDEIEPDMFETLYDSAVANDLDVLSMENVGSPMELTILEDDKSILESYLIGKIKISSWNKIYRRNLYPRFRFPVGKQIYEDCMAVYQAVSASNRVGLLNVQKYKYVQHENSNSRAPQFQNKYFDAIEIMDQITEEITEKYPDLARKCLQRKAATYLRICKIYCLRGHPKEFADRIRVLKDWLKEIPLRQLSSVLLLRTDRIRYLLFLYAFPLFMLMIKTVDKN